MNSDDANKTDTTNYGRNRRLAQRKKPKHDSFIKLSQENCELTQLLEIKEQLIKLHERSLQKF